MTAHDQSTHQWTFDEALVLASALMIQGSSFPADLSGLIGAADWINRSVLGREEIETTLNLLASHGMVDVNAGSQIPEIDPTRRGSGSGPSPLEDVVSR